jgi:hypothetical protein
MRRDHVTQTGLLHLLVDFSRLNGETIPVGPVDGWRLAGLRLTEEMTAVFEEPGELQMTGVLRRIASAVGPYWVGALDVTSLIYHIRLDAGTLTRAGPVEAARLPAPDPERAPAVALTLGVEGTHETWARSLTGAVPVVDGQPLTLVDGRDEVDARAQVAHLAPDAAYPEGRRVWLALPDWTTVRRIPWDHPADDETAPPVQTLLTWTPAPSDDYDAPGYQAETAALPGYYGRGATREQALADLDERLTQALAHGHALDATPAQPSATASAALLALRMQAAGAQEGAAYLAAQDAQALAGLDEERTLALADARLLALLSATPTVLLDSAEVVARGRRLFVHGWRSAAS